MKTHSFLKLCTALTSVFLLTQASLSASRTKDYANGSDPRLEYKGRVLKDSCNTSFDWSGTSLRICFSGKEVAIRCSDTNSNYFNVWIDKEPTAKEDFVVKTQGNDTTITIARNLKKGNHVVTLQKRTEGEQGTVTIHKVTTDGTILNSSSRKERYIEFIGDSYTCGYGTENSIKSDPFKPETENCNLTYAAIASRCFDADYSLVSHSGQGVARNYDGFSPEYTMVERYDQMFDLQKSPQWKADRVPDIVVVYLGENDFSTDKQPSKAHFTRKYIELLKKIKSNYGDIIPILCMASKSNPDIFEYVKSACIESRLGKVYYMTMQDMAHNSDSELGASWHPNYAGHRKIASCVIPYISTITGWEMPIEGYL